MKFFIMIFFIIIISAVFFVMTSFPVQDNIRKYDENSSSYIGATKVQHQGLSGNGVKIGIIDTGIDYNHSDLYGFGPEGKVVGGYNFVNENEPPLDTNGHGTEVAGIIAADGNTKGIAPNAKLYAYKVSDNGEAVSADLIVKAIRKAIQDKVDIINISLGVNKTNSKINDAVDEAIKNGILVVGAAGNDGPIPSTIGSPGNDPAIITTGATYNNLTSSLVATLEVKDFQYQVVPMLGDSILKSPISGKIVFGKYGRTQDLTDQYSGKILLEERGSDDEEKVYFSTKEKNAADAGAIGLIIYNNEPGLFLGELIHEYIEDGYHPRIPVVSMARDDGLKLKNLLENKTEGTLNVFSNPDYIVHFSSRGPVSPFYIKPDLVAPGAFINTTTTENRYNFTSGTSFAAPHVTGVAALLVEKHPELSNVDVKSLLLTTTDPATDAYGNVFPPESAGAGRLNATKAVEANLIITPPQIVFFLSSGQTSDEKIVDIKPIYEPRGNLSITFDVPDFIKIDYKLDGNKLKIKPTMIENKSGDFYGRLWIKNNLTTFNVPIEFHITKGTFLVSENNGILRFNITNPENWTYAKMTVTNSNNHKSFTTSFVQNMDTVFPIYQNGKYWIEAKIRNDSNTYDAYSEIDVENSPDESVLHDYWDIPTRQIMIIIAAVIIIGVIGVIFSRKTRSMVQHS